MRERARAALDGYRASGLDAASVAERGLTPSAVMLLLVERAARDHVVFQVRTHRVEHHRGEISFPGGRRDPSDESLLQTALRETEEEIGVPAERVEVFGRLDDTVTVASNFVIRPYVGAVLPGEPLEFVRAPSEVRELLFVPLDYLLAPESRAWKVVAGGDGEPVPTPAYRFEDHVIWGATARVLGQFLELLEGIPAGEGATGATGEGATDGGR